MIPSPDLTVLVCDDAQLVCDRLGELLATIPSVTPTAFCRTLATARAAVLAERPEVVIVDLNLPDGHGLHVIHALRAADLDTVVVVLSVEPASVWREISLKAGADFYLEKNAPVERLITLIEGLATCRTLFRRERQRSRSLRTALRDVDEGVAITDAAGAIRWANPAFTRLTGRSSGTVDGRPHPLQEILGAAESTGKGVPTSLASGGTKQIECVEQRPGGVARTIRHTVRAVAFTGPAPVRLVWTVREGPAPAAGS